MEERTCHITLVGPRGEKARSKMLRLGPWTKNEWRRLVVEFKVGTEQFPDWDSVNTCMQGVQDLIKVNQGKLTDTVIDALSANLKVIKYETFRGP